MGYYVNIDYTEPELRENPPSPPAWEKLQRNILATNPRYSSSSLILLVVVLIKYTRLWSG